MINLEKIKAKKTTQELLNFGIINIDKSSGPTSFSVSDFVRKTGQEVGIKKTSHFGTLDPKVTGVLPIALNRGCKLTGFFLGEDKEYVGVMRIHEDVPLKDIEKAISEKFLGNILQTPPKKSRVKRVERQREIMRFEILEKDGQDILFLAEVQGGTYIRKLISDLGDYMGIGSHMLELRRIRAGIFHEDDKEYPSVDLYEFEKIIEESKNGNDKRLREIVIPGEIVSSVYPTIEINDSDLKHVLTGKPIHKKDLAEKGKAKFDDGQIISVFFKERFIGMYRLAEKDDIFAMPEFVMN